MKKAIKILNLITIIFNIIGVIPLVIFAIICFLGGGAFIIEGLENAYGEDLASIPMFVYGIYMLVLTISSIIPIVIASITNKKLEQATSKNDLILWGVLCLVFANQISGILLLVMSEEQLTLTPSTNSVPHEEKTEEEPQKTVEEETVKQEETKNVNYSFEQLKK